MEFKNIVKGQITQTLVKTLFERAGYRVERFGVEELFNEVIHLSEDEYKKLGLPAPLRKLPDLLVADSTLQKAWLLEVKFRKHLTKEVAHELHQSFKAQFKYWPGAISLVVIGEHPNKWSTDNGGNRFIQDYIRIVTPSNIEKLVKPLGGNRAATFEQRVWNSMTEPQHVFKALLDSGTLKESDALIKTIRQLSEL